VNSVDVFCGCIVAGKWTSLFGDINRSSHVFIIKILCQMCLLLNFAFDVVISGVVFENFVSC